MERVFMGGAPVFPEDLRRAREVFPNAEITAVYGSTEAEPIAEVALSSISQCDFDAMEAGCGLLAGAPLNSIDLRIVRNRHGEPIPALDPSQFRACWVESGAVGEIVVSGDHVLTGYLNGEGDSETKFCACGKMWHRTGDLGRLDPSGRLWLMGRASAAIEDERGVIYPFAVECAARQISGIRRAAIARCRRAKDPGCGGGFEAGSRYGSAAGWRGRNSMRFDGCARFPWTIATTRRSITWRCGA